tara:strand:+ start:104 stop:1372 length:1269 start_codon:yes stop_codon:yes gene_type:complete
MVARVVRQADILTGVPGFCAVTQTNEGADCAQNDHKGSWVAFSLPTCLEWCHGCAQCRFVSFSKAHGDCSWFRSCKALRSGANIKGYQSSQSSHETWQVRFANGSSTSAVDFMRSASHRPSVPLNRAQRMLPTSKWAAQLDARRSRMLQVGANAHRNTSYVNDADPGPRIVALGWRALLIEPVPAIFASLRSTYPRASVVRRSDAEATDARLDSRVSLMQAAVCDGECQQESITMYSLDFYNRTNWGSDDADGRCMHFDDFNRRANAWYSEVASVSREMILQYQNRDTPRLCKACSEALGRPLAPNCMRRVMEANMVATEVPCLCLRRAVAQRRRGRPQRQGAAAVQLLVIDTEGHDAHVLAAYPFGEVETWRVQFESNKLNSTALAAARERLATHGFRPLQLGDVQRMPDDVWHHPGSGEA